MILYFKSSSSSKSNKKICQAFVISSRPTQTFYRSDSIFSNYGTILQQSKTSLLEHYLKTYNPLQIDLINTNQQTITTLNVKDEDISSEINTLTIDNCYPLNCTNKQTKQYTRLKEQENCSATMSSADHRVSECSTKLTSTILPIIMITDCSDSQRLHTEIIEMNEDE